jgi:uncharacterized protein YjbI with pentapeptide repeats
MKFDIKHRYSNEVLFSVEIGSLKLAVEAAVNSGVSLSGADFPGADFYGVNLSRANFSGANFSGADFSWANLHGANFSWADLSGVDFSRANLSGANFCGANFYGSNLYGANLHGVNLYGANLSGANLSGADLYGYISIGPIGSRNAFMWARWEDGTFVVKTGCFSGTIDDFKKAVKGKHTKGVHKDEYADAIKLIEARMEGSRAYYEASKERS